jgi:uncharacterized protein (DUF433 family)
MQIAPINHIEIRDGNPVIAGTGLKVAIIATTYVHHDVSIDWIAQNYDLTPAQIHAALSYYYDHAAELDRFIQEGDDLAKQIGIPSTEVLEQRRQRQRTNDEDKSK